MAVCGFGTHHKSTATDVQAKIGLYLYDAFKYLKFTSKNCKLIKICKRNSNEQKKQLFSLLEIFTDTITYYTGKYFSEIIDADEDME